MKFSNFAQGLFPFCSGGIKKSFYFTELIGNFIQDSAMDSCMILKTQDDTKYRYIKGKRDIQAKDAQYLYDYRDTDKFSDWLDEQMDNSDSFEAVSDWLHTYKIEHDNNHIASACAELLVTIFLEIISNSTNASKNSKSFEYDFELIDEIQKKINMLPHPPEVPVPKIPASEESVFISELYSAFGDAEGMSTFDKTDLSNYPEYIEDLADRRIDYYAAVSIRRGVMELGIGSLSNQFDVLKIETYDGVKDTSRRIHSNGYERMLAVMEKAISLDVKNYILSNSPNWISGKIIKGVCHHLVNEGRLKWVKKKNV